MLVIVFRSVKDSVTFESTLPRPRPECPRSSIGREKKVIVPPSRRFDARLKPYYWKVTTWD